MTLSLNSQRSSLNPLSCQDELGSTSHIAGVNGNLLEYYKYDLYGKPTYWVPNTPNDTQLSTTNYSVKDLFTGQRWIPELGLYDDRNRFMSPDLGRFLQPDPIGFKGDSSNLYRYCGNDWANRSDPMGLTDIDIPDEVVQKMFEASRNSIAESASHKDGLGRGQLVQHKVDGKGHAIGKHVLQNTFEKAKVVAKQREEYQKYHTGEPHRYVMQEGGDKGYKADPGNKMDGIGHGHQDVTGKPLGEAKFSPEDKATARGDAHHDGTPVGRIDESNPKMFHLLIPQVEHTESREKTFDASKLESKLPTRYDALRSIVDPETPVSPRMRDP